MYKKRKMYTKFKKVHGYFTTISPSVIFFRQQTSLDHLWTVNNLHPVTQHESFVMYQEFDDNWL